MRRATRENGHTHQSAACPRGPGGAAALAAFPLLAAGLIFFTLLLSGCTTQLAPAYDKTIVDSLTSANEQTMTLFAAVSSGPPSPFSKRESAYNEVIGKFDALRLQANSRQTPAPPPAALLVAGSDPVKQKEIADRLKAPTGRIVAKIATDLTRMRDMDRAGSLDPSIVPLFKNSYELSMDQVLTYEKALQR